MLFNNFVKSLIISSFLLLNTACVTTTSTVIDDSVFEEEQQNQELTENANNSNDLDVDENDNPIDPSKPTSVTGGYQDDGMLSDMEKETLNNDDDLLDENTITLENDLTDEEKKFNAENSDFADTSQLNSPKIDINNNQLIYFLYDESVISPKYQDILSAHADYLRSDSTLSVLIEGHTDERGTPEYNIALGERRAKSVAKYIQSLGVLPSQISIVSYGEEKPAYFDHDEESMAKNRRAILVY